MNVFYRPLLFAVVLTAVVGCSRPNRALEVGIIAPSFDYLPLRVAEADGRLKGLPLNLQRFSSGWELGEALVAGKLDVAIIPFTYVISARARGYDVAIAACLEHEDDGIIARRGIDRLEQLQGQRIGCLKASTIELLLRATLEPRGIKSELVYFSSPMEMWSALERGDVDALSYYVPGIIKAQGKLGNIIYWYSQDWPMHPCCDVAVHNGRIRTKQESVRHLLGALEAGVESISRDTARACSLAIATYGLSDSVARSSLRYTPFRLSLTSEEIAFELRIAALMQELGYIPTQVNAHELYASLKFQVPSLKQ